MSFEYFCPATAEEALVLLKKDGHLPFAGGTDILVNIKKGRLDLNALVDLKNIPELGAISHSERGDIQIGSMVTMAQIQSSEVLRQDLPALTEAAAVMGCKEIRNRATLGGNLANASPGADTAIPLLIYEAEIEVLTPAGRNTVPLNKFFLGPGKTVLQKGELIRRVIIKKENFAGSYARYLRQGRIRGMDLAAVSAALWYNPTQEYKFKAAGGAVLPVPARLSEVEAYLNSVPRLNDEAIARAQEIYRTIIQPRQSSLRGTPLFKKHIGANLFAQILQPIKENLEMGRGDNK